MPATLSVTIPSGSTYKRINITAADDELLEGDETFTVTIGDPEGPVGLLASSSSTPVTIRASDLPEDATPEVSVASKVTAIEGGNATITLFLTQAIDGVVSVPFTVAGSGTNQATVGTDFTVPDTYGSSSPYTVQFGLMSRFATIGLPITADSTAEAAETFTVTLGTPTAASTTIPPPATPPTPPALDDANKTATVTILGPTVRMASSAVSVAEGGTASITVSLNQKHTAAVTVPFTLGGNATSGTDYTVPSPLSVTIPAGSTSATISVTVPDDGTAEAAETFTVTLGTPTPSLVTLDGKAKKTTVTIAAALAKVASTVTAAEGRNASVTVSLTQQHNAAVTVPFTLEPGSATANTLETTDSNYPDGDYTAPATLSVTIPANTSSKAISIPILTDGTAEAAETFTVRLGTPSPSVVTADGANSAGAVTITGAQVSVPSAVSVTEGGTAAVTVSLSQAHTAAVTVPFTLAPGTALAGLDYTVPSTLSVTIPAGTTSATISVAVPSDFFSEDPETFTVTLGTPSVPAVGVDGANGTATVTISEALVTVPAAVSVNEGQSASVTVSLSRTHNAAVTVPFTVTAGSATAADYTAPGTLSVTIPAGHTSATISIPITADTTAEAAESFTVTLGTPTTPFKAHTTRSTTTVTIAAAAVSVPSTVTVAEGQSASVTVSLTQTSATAVTVPFTLAAGTATTADYTAPGTLSVTIAANTSSASISVPIVDDELHEGAESFTLTLGDPAGLVGVVAGGAAAAVVISPSDLPPGTGDPEVSVSSAVTAVEGGTASVVVALNQAQTSPVVVPYVLTTGTATSSDFTVVGPFQVTIPVAATSATLSIPITADGIAEAAESFTVTIGDPAGDVGVDDANKTATVTIAGAAVSMASATVSATEGGSASVTVSLSQTHDAAVSVPFTVTAGTATEGATNDYTVPLTHGTSSPYSVTIPAGSSSATISVTVRDDGTAEAAETFTVTLAEPDGVVALDDANKTATVTIAAALVAVAATATAAEGQSASLTVSLTQTHNAAVTVPFTVATGTASATDYTAPSPLSVTIAANTSSATISIPIVADNTAEGAETFTVTLGTPSPTAVGLDDANKTATVTIAAARISVPAAVSVSEDSSASITVSMTETHSSDVVVPVTVTTGTATAADYTAPASSVTISTGSKSATISIPITADDGVEVAESFRVTLGTPSAGSVPVDAAAQTTTVTIAGAEVTVGATAVSVSEGPKASASITVSLSQTHTTAVVVPFTVAGSGTTPATAGSDYTVPSPAWVVIPAGSTSATISVPILTDALTEAAETFTVTLGDPSGPAVVGTDATTTVTIVGAQVSVPAAVSAVEGQSAMVKVSLNQPQATDLAVPFTVTAGTATEGATNDYTVPSTHGSSSPYSVTIPANASSATISVTVRDDATAETAENFTVTLSDPTGPVGVDSAKDEATVTIGAALVSVPAAVSASEGSTATVTVSLSQTQGTALTVSFTLGGTATSADYTAPSPLSVTIPANSSSADISIPITTDTLTEGAETITVTLTDPAGTVAVDSANNVATVTIEPPGNVSVPSAVSASEGSSASVTVTLSAAQSAAVTVPFTLGGSATSGTDYTAPSPLSVTIPAGDTSAAISIPILDDGSWETAETFTVTLSDPAGSVGLDNANKTTTVTITGALVSVPSAVTAEEGDLTSALVTVSLNQKASTALTVPFTLTAGTATSTDYTAPSPLSVTIPANSSSATISIPIPDDGTAEVAETFTVTLSDPTGTVAVDGTNNAATVTIAAAAVRVLPTATLYELGWPEPVHVFMNQTHNAAAVTVPFTVTAGTATAGTDYTVPSPATVTIPAGKLSGSVDFTSPDDTELESDEYFDFTISDPADPTGGVVALDQNRKTTRVTVVGSVLFVVADWSGRWQDDPLTEGMTVTIEVYWGSGLYKNAFDAEYAVIPGTATPDDYFGKTSGTLTIPANGFGATSAPLTIVDDALAESAETFTVVVRDPPGTVGVLDGSDHETVTIAGSDGPTAGVPSFVRAVEGYDASVEVSLNSVFDRDVVVPFRFEDRGGSAYRLGEPGSGLRRALAVVGDDSRRRLVGDRQHPHHRRR